MGINKDDNEVTVMEASLLEASGEMLDLVNRRHQELKVGAMMSEKSNVRECMENEEVVHRTSSESKNQPSRLSCLLAGVNTGMLSRMTFRQYLLKMNERFGRVLCVDSRAKCAFS